MRIAGLFPQVIAVDARLDPDPEEPLGIEYVLAAAAQYGNEVALFTPLMVSLECLSTAIAQFRPDVLAVSLYTPHVPDALMICSQVRQLCPDVVVVVGGPHASAEPVIVLDPNIDIVVIGEGEATFCDLLRILEDSGDLRSVRGIAFEEQGRVTMTSPRGRIAALDSLAYPLYERRYYDLRAWSVSYPRMSNTVYAPMVFSRGCSMPCEFCSSHELWGHEVHSRSPRNVVAEMKHLRDTYGVNFIYFEDLTFTLRRERFLDLCNAMEEEKTGLHWGCETHVNAVLLTHLRAMAAAGCTKILWGVENLDDGGLLRMKKQQTSSDVRRSLAQAADVGILNWGCYIIGFPWESERDILGTSAHLVEYDIHQLRLSIATPFPGSQWYKQMPASSLNPNLALYDTNHLVYDHPTISPERMKDLQNEVFVRFYKSAKYRDRAANMVRRFPHLRESFDEFLSYIDSKIALLEGGETEITEIYGPQALVVERVLA